MQVIEQLDLDAVRAQPGFWYLASPYTMFPDGREAGFQEVARAAAWLALREVKLFCPVTHSHPIAKYGHLANEHSFWMGFDRPFMETASGLILCLMEGYEDSRGMREELEFFRESNKGAIERGDVERKIFRMQWPMGD